MKTQRTFKISQVCKLVLIMLGAFLAFPSVTNAQTAETEEMKYIIVWDNEGGCISFPLEEKPVFKYNMDESTVSCITTSNTIDLPINDVCKYTLDTKPAPPSSIENETTGEGGMSYASDIIYLSNFKAHTTAYVYTAYGSLIGSYKADAEGNLSISMGNWTSGIYIVKVNNVSYKICKK